TRMTMGHELLRIWSTTSKTVLFITHSLTEAVYLADEVLVMSARPGRLIDHIEVTLPRPRSYEMMATEQFGRLRDRIWQQIRKTPCCSVKRHEVDDVLAGTCHRPLAAAGAPARAVGGVALDGPAAGTVPTGPVEDAGCALYGQADLFGGPVGHALRGCLFHADRLRPWHSRRGAGWRHGAAARPAVAGLLLPLCGPDRDPLSNLYGLVLDWLEFQDRLRRCLWLLPGDAVDRRRHPQHRSAISAGGAQHGSYAQPASLARDHSGFAADRVRRPQTGRRAHHHRRGGVGDA